MTELIDITVYYLEMLERPVELSVPERTGVEILPVQLPSVEYYRFLYDAVGKDYRWLSRRKLTDEELKTIIQHPDNRMSVLHVAGSPAGFAELDCRDPVNVELVQFGLLGDYHGQKLGSWFLSWVIDSVWKQQAERFWLHTCSLDHPAALSMYQKAGFQLFRENHVQREY